MWGRGYKCFSDQDGDFIVESNRGLITAQNIVAATGPFQTPVIPSIIADDYVHQIHSSDYRNPKQLDDGAVLVVGAGSSGSQIADELLRAGRKVYLQLVHMTDRRGLIVARTLYGGLGNWVSGK